VHFWRKDSQRRCSYLIGLQGFGASPLWMKSRFAGGGWRGEGADGRREGGKKTTEEEKEVLKCSFKMKYSWKMEGNVCTTMNINTNLLN